MSILDSSNLRNPITFPLFESLPYENDIDETYYRVDFLTYAFRPCRHWRFLGEIVDAMTLVRLRLQVKDKDGRLLPVYFHTDGRGALFAHQCKKGHTVAILYGQQHDCWDKT